MSGDAIVVGAWGSSQGATDTGVAYVYRYDGMDWIEEQKLIPSDAAAGDFLGDTVAISGDAVILGASQRGTLTGVAYAFRYNGTNWVEEQIISVSSEPFDSFAKKVSVWGDVAVIGASGDDGATPGSGAVYVFRYDGTAWVVEQVLTASDGAQADDFGDAVSVWGDVIAVGAQGHTHAGFTDAGTVYIYRYDGAAWVEEVEFVPSDAQINQAFGWSVGVFGDTVLVGAAGDNESGVSGGSAYIYRYNGTTWVEEEEVFFPQAVATDFFGDAVSISGDVVLVGSRLSDILADRSGSAYIYRFAGPLTYSEEQKVTASDAFSGDNFGGSVSISGDVALVGAEGDGGNRGAAYISRYNGTTDTWIEEQKLQANAGNANDLFGNSVSVFGDVALVGERADSDAGNDTGSAHVFRYDGNTDTWEFEQKLTASDATGGDSFGRSVAIWGDTALVGTDQDDDNGDASGAAYIYRYDGVTDTWLEEQKLTPSDGKAGDWFGYVVAIYGDVAVITSYADEVNGTFSGSAYVFRYSESTNLWIEEQRLLPDAGDPFDIFGTAIDVFGDTIIVGTSRDDDAASEGGAAYIFRYQDDASLWEIEKKLFSSVPIANENFGGAVSIAGDVALVGAIDFTGGPGAAYFYRYNGTDWVFEERVQGSDGVLNLTFGTSVAIDGGAAIISDVAIASSAGAAYIFRADQFMNSAPVSVPGDTYFAECRDQTAGTTATLDGSGSFDPNKDDITYTWGTDLGTFDDNTLAQPTLTLTGEGLGAVANVTLEVSDGMDTNQVATTVTVRDTQPPNLFINGSSTVTIECEVEMYTELGAGAFDECDGSVSVTIGGDSVMETVPGVYVVTYDAMDSSGNAAPQQLRTVTVQDTLPPAITLNGDAAITIECGIDTYTEPGAEAFDECEGNLLDVVVGGDVVDTKTPGDYIVTYNISDSSNNAAAQVTRTVTVQDTTAPVITLTGDNPLELIHGDAFTEPGFSADDACEGDLTTNIVVTGSVDTSTIGSYELTYTVSDNAGNQAQVVRTVNVVAAATDVNEDGTTNSVDIQTLINIVLGIFTGTADVNNDGMTNSVDIQLVINAVLGI